jgi:gamma-glutamylcyclotransferase (GGCT)/AIG2-like uncharacterized protein YtfP
MSSNISPFILKLRSAPEGYFFKSEGGSEQPDLFAPPTGPYFFYGTLSDPAFLSEVLNLSEKPTLRPAMLMGYTVKLWGPYPALVDGPTGATVEGMVYEVGSEKHGERLAEYETSAYTTAPCRIRFTDGEKPEEVSGTTFKYAGNPLDIDEGQFDLKLWLQRMGRAGKEHGGASWKPLVIPVWDNLIRGVEGDEINQKALKPSLDTKQIGQNINQPHDNRRQFRWVR